MQLIFRLICAHTWEHIAIPVAVSELCREQARLVALLHNHISDRNGAGTQVAVLHFADGCHKLRHLELLNLSHYRRDPMGIISVQQSACPGNSAHSIIRQ